MARSIQSRQKALLHSGFLDLSSTGESRLEFKELSLNIISDVLLDLAVRYIEFAQDNLQSSDRIATGRLAASIIASEVQIFGKVYQIEISLDAYYKFVDQGVKGWADEKGGSSPYQFKKTAPSKRMVTEIRKWVIREGLKGRGMENKKKVGMRDQKRHTITDTSTQVARMISSSIKKKGLKGSHFWTRTQNQMIPIVKEELGLAAKAFIIENLTNKK